jgi:hypothetical protein
LKTDDYDDTQLEQLIRILDPKKMPTGHLGVLGDKATRAGGVQTNAEIGATHELGIDVVRRSWLRVPLIDNWEKYLKDAGAFKAKAIRDAIKAGSLRKWMDKAMIVGERIIADGFNSGGFGKWPPSDMRFKKNAQTLVETQQLRNSVTSKVEGG